MSENTDTELSVREQQILSLLDAQGGYLRTRDFRKAGLDPHLLSAMVHEDRLERIRRGLYRRPELDGAGEHQALLDVMAVAPNGVICLLTALAFHELTTTVPWEVYLAVTRKARPPKVDYPPVRVVRYGDRIFDYRVEVHPYAHDRAIRVYSPEKSIADAFRFQRMLGTGIALEALRTYMQRPTRNLQELLEVAKHCGVLHHIDPAIRVLV